MAVDGMTYLLVDGENIDWALGGILDRKPEPHERPRWQHIVQFAEAEWGQPVRWPICTTWPPAQRPDPHHQPAADLQHDDGRSSGATSR